MVMSNVGRDADGGELITTYGAEAHVGGWGKAKQLRDSLPLSITEHGEILAYTSAKVSKLSYVRHRPRSSINTRVSEIRRTVPPKREPRTTETVSTVRFPPEARCPLL